MGHRRSGVARLRDGRDRRLTNKGTWEQSSELAEESTISKDGKYLGFDDRVPGRPTRDRDVLVLAVDGSGEVKAVVSPGQDIMMGWSPDGTLLLFASDRTGSVALWSVPVAAGRLQGTPVLLRPEIAPTSLGVTAGGALFVGATISDRDIRVAGSQHRQSALSAGAADPDLHGFELATGSVPRREVARPGLRAQPGRR